MEDEARQVREALDHHPVALKPAIAIRCRSTFLDDGERMGVVDWEYAGMNDPMWDLGDSSVARRALAKPAAGIDGGLLRRSRAPRDVGRMVIYKAMCDLLWTLWG